MLTLKDITIGDQLVNKAGRKYRVTDVGKAIVQYAYVPASGTDVVLEGRALSELCWVRKVLRNGTEVWPQRFQFGDKVTNDSWDFFGVYIGSSDYPGDSTVVFEDSVSGYAVETLPTDILEAVC